MVPHGDAALSLCRLLPPVHFASARPNDPSYLPLLSADSLGNILSSPNTIAEAPGWTPDAQLRLAAEALAPQLQQDASTLLDQVGVGWAGMAVVCSAVRQL